MIRLTRLNQSPLVLNSDLIEHIEMTPDTVISLTTGQKLMVRETAAEIIERVINFRRSIVSGIAPYPWPARQSDTTPSSTTPSSDTPARSAARGE
jgi:flagellar protein FlbD